MNDIYLKSYAKINLSLDVLKKRKDGYHNIDTIFQRIDLFDELDIKLADKEDCIILSEKPLSVEKSENLIYKAWQALKGYRKEKTSKVKVIRQIVEAYAADARKYERVGDWAERIGWERFFEKTGLEFSEHMIDDFRDPAYYTWRQTTNFKF